MKRLKWEEHNKIFTQSSKKPIHPSTIAKWYYYFIRENGLKESHLHSLRHTFATTMTRNGVDIKAVPEILGHEDVSSALKIYHHTIDEQKQSAVTTLNNFY